MTDIPEKALEKAFDLLGWGKSTTSYTARDNVARFIADVSETVSEALAPGGLQGASYKRLQALILPNPEDDLLKEAREIVEQLRWETGESAMEYAVRCTIAALKHRKDG